MTTAATYINPTTRVRQSLSRDCDMIVRIYHRFVVETLNGLVVSLRWQITAVVKASSMSIDKHCSNGVQPMCDKTAGFPPVTCVTCESTVDVI